MTAVKAVVVAIGAIGIAAAIAPASLIDASLAARTQQRIRLSDTKGFWWRGSGILASADGTQRLPINWQLDAGSLVRGAIVVRLGHGEVNEPVAGTVSLRSNGIDVTNVRIRMPAAFVAAFDARLNAVTFGGTVDAVAPSLSTASDFIAGNVDSTWERARVVVGDAVLDLGTVTLKSTAASDRWSASIKNTGGNVAVAGTIEVSGANTSGTVEVRPAATASAAVRNVLAQLGVPDETGAVRITWQNPR